MLTRLNIQNYALIEDIDIPLEEGLSALTGETGAGKSIILGAISLLTGNRADQNAVKKTDKKCVVEAEFDISGLGLREIFNQLELEYQDQTIIRREFSKDGRSRVFINDSPAAVLHLKTIVNRLLDVHSQHENLELNSKAYQLQAIDAFAGNAEKLSAYHKKYNDFLKSSEAFEKLRADSLQLRENTEFLVFQLNELNDANLTAGEQEQLEEEQRLLANSEEISSNLKAIESILNADVQNPGEIIDQLLILLRKTSVHMHELADLERRLESLSIELQDISRELTIAGEKLIHDPERALFVEDRLSVLYRLQQKHRVNGVQELIDKRDQLHLELENIQNLDERLEEAEKEFNKQKKFCTEQAGELSDRRMAAKAGFEKEIMSLLKKLGMPDARFEVALSKNQEFNKDGINSIDFLFSANKGIEAKSLGKVASGGELSRLMLSIKAVLARKSELPTIIFDEIDTGISGEIAEKMGRIILDLSKSTQAIIITHLPQIAALASHHFRVYKDSGGKETKTRMHKLGKEERTAEIARLLSGEQVSKEAVDNAKVLLGFSG